MGDVSDIADLLGKALHEKRMKLLWTVGSALATVVVTTGTVSWKMSRYVAELERSNDEMKGHLLVLDKKIEALTDALTHELKDLRSETQEARIRADRALLVAQLMGGGREAKR